MESTNRRSGEPDKAPPRAPPRRHRRRAAPTQGARDERLRSLRDALRLATAGDLSVRLPTDGAGDALAAETAQAFNTLAERNESLLKELDRMAAALGEGRLDERASLGPVGGGWASSTGALNALVRAVARQTAEATRSLERVVEGDLSYDMSLRAEGQPLQGDFLQLGRAVNDVLGRLRRFTAEIVRVAREVGDDGKLGGQAQAQGLSGVWRDVTASVNGLATNLTEQVRNIAVVTTAVANGDLSQKITVRAEGEILELKNTINSMVDRLRTFGREVTRVAREVGTEGKLGGQALVPGAGGTWQELIDGVNVMASNLTSQVRGIARVVTAVAQGDLTQRLVLEARGEIAALADTINGMADTLRAFAEQVTTVAREVGLEGKLGGQARVPGAAGTWKALTDSVNMLAGNLTSQVRNIALVTTAVADGDLSRTITVEARGEILALKNTINGMTDTLRTFADQVTTVAREVGTEGKLGGQARVPGAAGIWRDLTDNVNRLAANLTTQVRAISDVASAVIAGDLTQRITAEAHGEVRALADTIDQMIGNLRDTTHANQEQNWLKSNLARFFALMQGQHSLESLTSSIMEELTPAVGARHGAFYLRRTQDEQEPLTLAASYAYVRRKHLLTRFALGEGLVGQCALEKKPIVVTEVPEGYVQITSGLGQAPPRNLAVLPVLFEKRVLGVVELASFQPFTDTQLSFLEQLMLNIGIAINIIGSSVRTEELLGELQRSNQELEHRRTELEEKAQLLELRNREIAQASASLESKAEELSRVSQYKSQFLANMSHELRTPLNGMMVLAQTLAANEAKNLTPEQQRWAASIHQSGQDLLGLIGRILDVSKVESGRVEAHPESRPVESLRAYAEQAFRATAEQRGLTFDVEVADGAPRTLTTDHQLLKQILGNLLGNAIKFTEHGHVRLRIDRAPAGTSFHTEALRHAPATLACAVSDSGIGVPPDKQALIFEPFQQADASFTRKYGGTGLGLAICREYARVLGGEIDLRSKPGVGSTFTLYLPLRPGDAWTTEPSPPARTSAKERPSVQEEAPAPAASAPPGEAGRPLEARTILVIENDARVLYPLVDFLEQQGACVLPAATLREARACLDEHPDVAAVVLDLVLPDADGREAARAIHAAPERARLPLVALAGDASPAVRDGCLAAGCTACLEKPVDTARLLDVLRPAAGGARP